MMTIGLETISRNAHRQGRGWSNITHLANRDLLSHKNRPQRSEGGHVATSCRCVLEIDQGARLGLDFMVLGPALWALYPAHKGTLGWATFWARAASPRADLYAPRGVGPLALQPAWRAGARGTAAIRGLWDLDAAV